MILEENAEEQIIRQEKDYKAGWLEGYNKCLEDYNIMQMAMVQYPHYTFPIDEGNKVLVEQISNLQLQLTEKDKQIEKMNLAITELKKTKIIGVTE